MSPEPPPSGQVSRRGLALTGMIAIALVTVVVIDGVWSRNASDARLREVTNAQSVPTVAVIQPTVGANQSSLDLPGRLEAPRSRPSAGRPSPARRYRRLASAQAAQALATVTAQRWQTMGATNAVAKQTVDEKTGDLTVKQALTRAAQANVDRLLVLSDFKRVTAPFDGIVTTRNTDVGQLINADSSAGLALFVISDVKKLRLTVGVPQNYVPAVTLNTKVAITVPEYPGKVYQGVVEASARAIDPASGTTRMQVVVDNSSGELMPGAFANTRIELPANTQALSIPAGALIFGEKGLRVAVLDGTDKIKLKNITISRDLGQVVEIGTGLSRDDRVIDSPPDGLSDGDPVRVVSGPATKK